MRTSHGVRRPTSTSRLGPNRCRINDQDIFLRIFIRFRAGICPYHFPNAQFPRGSEALNQWWRQQTPDTAPTTDAVAAAAVATMFDQIGPAVLITHSASGVYGWETATQSKHLRLCARHAGVPIGCGSPASSSGSLGPDHRDAYLASRFPEAHKNPDRDYLGRQFPDRRTAALALSGHRDLARAHHHGAEVRRSNQRARRPPLSDASSDIGIHGNSHFAFASTSRRIRRCHSPFRDAASGIISNSAAAGVRP